MIFCQESNFLLKCILTGCVVCFLRLFMRKNFDTDKPCWHFCLVASNKGKNHRTQPFPCLVLSDVIIYSGISSFCDFWSNVSFFSACCVLLYVVNLPWKLSSLRHFQGPPSHSQSNDCLCKTKFTYITYQFQCWGFIYYEKGLWATHNFQTHVKLILYI